MKPKPPLPSFDWLLIADPERVKRASLAMKGKHRDMNDKREKTNRAAVFNRGVVEPVTAAERRAKRKAKRRRSKR